MSYLVKTTTFEGPLDALLELIERRKLLINDISLTQVADDYIAYVRSMPELPLGETAEFVALAATLLLIKSRSLLPVLELTEGEEDDIDMLKRRLALHQLFKKAGGALGKVFDTKTLALNPYKEPEPLFLPDATITLEGLRKAAADVLFSFPKVAALPETSVKTIVSIEEMIERLMTRVEKGFSLSFKDFSKIGAAPKQEIIVTFLALLELVKQGIIRATQSEDFGDITLESDTVSVPSYE
jgi:segregation and condensation protein A